MSKKACKEKKLEIKPQKADYICKKCDKSAKKKNHLCKPVKIAS
jgi:hypothetical protein